MIRVTASGRLCSPAGTTIGGSSGARLFRAVHWGDEVVAASRHSDDVAAAVLAIPEGPAQSADLDLQIGFFNKAFRPDARDQFVLADHLAGALDQKDKNEGAAAEPHRPVALKRKPLLWEKRERAKRNCASARRGRPWLLSLFCPFLPHFTLSRRILHCRCRPDLTKC
jgi:hypothetical protein